MKKIEHDKYYTNDKVVSLCLAALKDELGAFDDYSFLEPSAGNGAFSSRLPNCIAYDLYPEHKNIIKQDYLTTTIEFSDRRVVVGNPPFGDKMNLCVKFFKKAIEQAPVVAFILPISQKNNNRLLYEYDLIRSIDLGLQAYSGIKLHCCFNIYRIPKNNRLHKSPSKNKLKSVQIFRQDSKKFKTLEDYDLCMCYWGNSSAGKTYDTSGRYSAEYKIKIDNKFKEKVIGVLTSVNWKEELDCIAALKIQQYHVVDLLKREIPDII